MKTAIAALGLFCSMDLMAYSDIGATRCGSQHVGQMLRQGWQVESQGYIQDITPELVQLDDGSVFRADMTVGMLAGDEAILLSKYVRTEKTSGMIFTLCAGGFDAWVTPR